MSFLYPLEGTEKLCKGMTLISPCLKIKTLHADNKSCLGYLVVIGIVEMEGNTIPVCDADTLSTNEDKTRLHR